MIYRFGGISIFERNGDYYCINAYFSYPINVNNLLTFIKQLSHISQIDNISIYDVNYQDYVYDDFMDGKYLCYKGSFVSIEDNVLESLEFVYCGCCFRLIFEYYDEEHYGISILRNDGDDLCSDDEYVLKTMFYNMLSPLYGNDGIEADVQSLFDGEIDFCSYNVYLDNSVIKDLNITNQYKYIKLKYGRY